MRSLINLAFILLAVSLVSCQSNNDTSPTQSLIDVPFSLKIAMNNAPSNVVTVEGTIERNGYDPITRSFTIENDTAYANFGQIIAGTWHLSVTAFDSNSIAVYSGETDVNITAGQINTVLLQLDPLTGGLIVVVIWNTPPSSEEQYIYVYSHSNSPRHVYRYNLQSDVFEQLTTEDKTAYPVFRPSINKIGYTNNEYGEYWLMNTDGSNKQFYFNLPTYPMYHQSYSDVTNKIFFYILNGTQQMCVMDHDGQNFAFLADNILFNNANPEINIKGDSLLFNSDRNGISNIFIMELPSQIVTQLTFNTTKSSHAFWSPNTNGFYYRKQESDGSTKLIYHSLNTNVENIIFEPNGLYFHYFGSPSPDESQFALICSEYISSTSGPQNLYIYDRNLGSLTQKTFENVLLANPRWYDFNQQQ